MLVTLQLQSAAGSSSACAFCAQVVPGHLAKTTEMQGMQTGRSTRTSSPPQVVVTQAELVQVQVQVGTAQTAASQMRAAMGRLSMPSSPDHKAITYSAVQLDAQPAEP